MNITKTIQAPFQFAFHDRVSKTDPGCVMFERCMNMEAQPLTREEKDKFFMNMRSNSGGTIYRQSGWAYPMKQFLKRYIVKYNYESGWSEIWAFDKTCIRNCYYTNSQIVEIKELP